MIRKVIWCVLLLLMFQVIITANSHAVAFDVTGQMVYYWGDLKQYSGWDGTKLVKDAQGPQFKLAGGMYNDISVVNMDINAALSDQVTVGTRMQSLFDGNPATYHNQYQDMPADQSWWGPDHQWAVYTMEYNQSEPAKNMYITIKNVFDIADIHIAENTRLSKNLYAEQTAFMLHSITCDNPGGEQWNGVNRGWITWPEGTTQFAPGAMITFKPLGPVLVTVAANDGGNRSKNDMLYIMRDAWGLDHPNPLTLTNGTVTTDLGTVVRATNGYMANVVYNTPISGISVGTQWEAMWNFRQNTYFWTEGLYKGVSFKWCWVQQDEHGITKDEGGKNIDLNGWGFMLKKAVANVLSLKYNLEGIQLSGVYSYASDGMERWDSWHGLGNVHDYWLEGKYAMMDGNLTPKVGYRAMRQKRTKDAIFLGCDYILAPGVTISPEVVFDNQTAYDGIKKDTGGSEYKNRAYAIFVKAGF